MSCSKQSFKIRLSRAEHERSDKISAVSIAEWRKQSLGWLEDSIGAEGSERVKKTRWNRVEQDDWI